MKTSNTSERLKLIMEDRNLRQVDILNIIKPLSKKLGIRLEKNDLSQYVSGKVEPNQDKLTLLSKALNVSEIWLMGFDIESDNEKSQIYSDDEYIIFSKNRKLKDGAENFIHAQLDAITEELPKKK